MRENVELTQNLLQVPEDIALILNDSSLYSKDGGDITTKEILRRYGDRAKVPTASPGQAGDGEQSRSRDTRAGSAPVVTRGRTDPHPQTAWQNEASVRTVGHDRDNPYANMPYVQGNGNSDPSQGSEARSTPSRTGARGANYDRQRAVGLA